MASSFLQKSEGRQWGWGKEFLFLKNITAARAPFGASRPAGWARGRRGPAGSQCTVRLVLTPAPARPRPRPLVSRPRHRLSASAANLWQLVREGTIAAGSVWLASAGRRRSLRAVCSRAEGGRRCQGPRPLFKLHAEPQGRDSALGQVRGIPAFQAAVLRARSGRRLRSPL